MPHFSGTFFQQKVLWGRQKSADEKEIASIVSGSNKKSIDAFSFPSGDVNIGAIF